MGRRRATCTLRSIFVYGRCEIQYAVNRSNFRFWDRLLAGCELRSVTESRMVIEQNIDSYCFIPCMVPGTGLEPANPCECCHLKAVRLPILLTENVVFGI